MKGFFIGTNEIPIMHKKNLSVLERFFLFQKIILFKFRSKEQLHIRVFTLRHLYRKIRIG